MTDKKELTKKEYIQKGYETGLVIKNKIGMPVQWQLLVVELK